MKAIDGRIRDAETIVDVLVARASRGEEGGFSFLADGETVSESITWNELASRTCNASAAIRRHARPGDRALLFFRPGLDFLPAFLGCLHAGVIAVPCIPPLRPFRRSFERIERIVRSARPSVAIAGPKALPSTGIAEAEQIGMPTTLRAEELLAPAPASPSSATPDAIAFLQYTSGSTSAPKGVIVSHRNLMHNLGYIHECAEHRRNSVSVIWLPVFHDMGLIDGLLAPLFGGFQCFAMPPHAFVQRPARWLRALSRYRGTHGGGPNFAYQLCLEKVSPAEAAELDLSSWRAAHNGAEPIRQATMEAFAERFSVSGFRIGHFHPCYGLAEATLKVSGGSADHLTPLTLDADALEQGHVRAAASGSGRTRIVASSGMPFRDFDLVIADPDTHEQLGERRLGEIWLAGPSVATGYYGDEETTRATFEARLEPDGRGPFLRTGDVGFLAGGELYVVGRLKDLIIFAGRNLHPHDIERSVESAHACLSVGCAVAFSVDDGAREDLVVLFECSRAGASDEESNRPIDVVDAVIRTIARDHQVDPSLVAALPRGSLLRTSSGKIRRRDCKKAFDSSSFDVLAQRELSDAPAEASRAHPAQQVQPSPIGE
jgi:acyl-CoA synthetase (AMP-forming)/AMP-acid ligase II